MNKWAAVALLWFVCVFNYADRQAIYSVFPLLKTEMGLTDVQLGIVGASFMWVYAAAAPLAGIVGDRFSRKRVIIGGLIFWSAITVATALQVLPDLAGEVRLRAQDSCALRRIVFLIAPAEPAEARYGHESVGWDSVTSKDCTMRTSGRRCTMWCRRGCARRPSA